MANKLEEIGLLFLRRRKELGMTQAQLGKKVGVNKSEISKIENGRSVTTATINKISAALGVSPEVVLKSSDKVSADAIHYIVMCLGLFSRKYALTRKEACNYLARFKGLQFSIENYEVEHQLSLQESVEDMVAVCRRNGGGVV